MAEMQAVILALLCLVLKIAAGTNVCKFDGVFFGGSCYSFVNETASWFDAQAVCKASGAYVAQLESQVEHDFVKNELIARGFGSIWLGGTEIFKKGTWRWMSNGDALGPFINWAEGQQSGSYEDGEHCLEMWRDTGYTWNDGRCTYKLSFVCEMK